VNFRQGVLGHLYMPGVSPGNLALLDIIAALRWVQGNIEAFGGDPSCVTVFGQSSGGTAIAALLDMPAANGLFRRAILQSAPLGRPWRSKSQAAELGERFAACLHADARTAPIEALLAAQAEFARTFRPVVVGASEQAFMPVVDGEVLHPPGGGWGRSVEVIVGTLREEQAAAFFVDPSVQSADWRQVAKTFEHVAGDSAEAALRYYRRRRPGATPPSALCDLFTDVLFRLDTLRFAANRSRSWVYQFDWPSPAGFGACHCLELPFVFGNLEAFSDAPMLEGLPIDFFGGLSRSMQDAWTAFARTGDPNHPELPTWTPYRDGEVTLRLDRQIEAIRDLADLASHPLH
jgi:para-nitrobenzyl esterase